MGKYVNVVRNGETVSIPEEDAQRLFAAGDARPETDQESQRAAVDAANADRASGVAQGAKALLEGAADTLTGGAYGKIAGAISPEYGEDLANRGQHRPGMRAIGELAGFALPGAAAKLGVGVLGEATLPGLASRAAGAFESKAVGRLVEGGILGLGGSVAASNVTGDPLSIEGVVEDVGIAGALNVGIGALADKLMGSGNKAKEALARAEQSKADLRLLADNEKKLLQNENWDTFRATHDDAVKAARKTNRAADAADAEYAKWTDPSSAPGKLRGAIKVTQKAKEEVQSRLLNTEFGQEYKAAQTAAKRAETDFQKQAANYEKWTGSSKAPTAINKIQDALGILEKNEAQGAKNWAKLKGKAGRLKAEAASGDFPSDVKAAAARGDEFSSDVKAAARGGFADEVRAAAKNAERFGDRKVYIDSLYENMPEATRGTLDEFKAKLLKANKAGEIELTRADMIPSHPQERIQGSSTKADGAEFHLMVDEPGAAAAKGTHEAPSGPAPQATQPGMPKTPVTAAERIADWKERLAQARRKFGKGWDTSSTERWVPGGAPDVDSAIEELGKIRDEIRYHHPTGKAAMKLPNDLPKVPVKREVPMPDINLDPAKAEEIRALSAASRDLNASVSKATEHLRAGKYELAMGELDAAAARARGAGLGDLEFPKFPQRTPRVIEGVKGLPKSVAGFARMTPQKVEEMAAAVEQMTVRSTDPLTGMVSESNPVAASFARVLDDLGIEAQPGIADSIRGAHLGLKQYAQAMDRIEAEAAAEAAKAATRKKGLFQRVGDTAKKGVEYGFARHFDTGGFSGAFMRTMAGMGAGYALDGMEGAAIGASLLASKAGIQSKVAKLVAKGVKAGSILHELRPITSYLGTQFPTGDRDEEPDLLTQARNRVLDIHSTAQAAPDIAFMAVQGAFGGPGDVAYKTHQALVGAVTYLAQTAPRDPGLDKTLDGSNWTPSYQEAIEFAHRIEAVVDPLSAIARTVAGDGHPAATEALWARWPALMNEYAHEFMMSDRSKMTYEAEARLAELLRVDVGLNQPAIILALQGAYLPQPTPPPGAQPSAPTGRPPAVKSTVAGSSVSQLIA